MKSGAEVYSKAESAEELYRRAMGARDRIETSFWDLGVALSLMRDKRYYYGCESWTDFCENSDLVKTLGIRSRTVGYLISIVTTFGKLGIKKEECARIGWSRLKEVTPIVTKENAGEWLKKAEVSSVEELRHQVGLATGKRSEENSKEKARPMTFPVYETQRETIERALEHIGNVTGSESKGYRLECLAIDYLSGAEDQGGLPKAETVRRLAERMQAVFYIGIGEIVDKKTGEIIFENKA